ncbi:MAG: GxxExxY protein [Bacteroidota bacterium]
MKNSRKAVDEISYAVIGAAIEVHKSVGPGLLENVYHKCMIHELKLRELDFESEFQVPVHYKGVEVSAQLRCDFFVENHLVVELKAVDQIHPIHEAQLLTYMKLLEAPKGVIINFNVTNIFREGQRTFVNALYSALD